MQTDQRRGASETGTIPKARVRHKERFAIVGGSPAAALARQWIKPSLHVTFCWLAASESAMCCDFSCPLSHSLSVH